MPSSTASRNFNDEKDEEEQKMMTPRRLKKMTALEKKQNTIVFSFDSKDKFIRRAALLKGWVETESYNNHLFNVKWEYSTSNNIFSSQRNQL